MFYLFMIYIDWSIKLLIFELCSVHNISGAMYYNREREEKNGPEMVRYDLCKRTTPL